MVRHNKDVGVVPIEVADQLSINDKRGGTQIYVPPMDALYQAHQVCT